MAIASPHHVFDLADPTEVVIEASSDTAYFTLRLFSPSQVWSNRIISATALSWH